MFIQTESTPNPESIKFVPGREVLSTDSESTASFYAIKSDKSEISRSPLAKCLFDIDGVKSIYLGRDFITVTKRAENHWMHLRTEIFSAIMDFYSSGKPALLDTPEVTDTTIFEDDDEVVAMIKELLETRIRPAVQEDGGDIKYVGFDPHTGIVSVRLAGSCVGCPSSSVTLKNGVENMLMHYIPEVTNVISVEDEDSSEAAVDNIIVEKSGGGEEEPEKLTSYEERLKAAGIPYD